MPGAESLRLVLVYMKGLVARTVHTMRFEEKVAGTCPKNSNWFELVELVALTKFYPAT